MNSSKYKDKQITELSESGAHNFLGDESDDEDGSPIFSFHPTHSSHQLPSNALDESHVRGWSSLDQIDSKRSCAEKVGDSRAVSLISEIDRRMKDHVDALLHPMGCLSAWVYQMESRTRQMVNSVGDLKESIEYIQGKSNAKLRELENLLIEVQDGIQDLRDKQEIAEVKLRLEALPVSKDDVQLGTENRTTQSDLDKEASLSPSQQAHVPPPISTAVPLQPPTLTYNVTSLPFQNHHPITPAAAPPQMSTLLVQKITPFDRVQESYHPHPTKSQETTNMQYHAGPAAQPHPSSYTHQSHQPLPPIPLNMPSSQIPQVHSSFSVVNPPFHSPPSHHPYEVPYLPSYAVHKSYQPPGRSLPSQQANRDSAQQLHHHLLNRQYFESSYSSSQSQALQPQGPTNINDYSYGASPRHGNRSDVKSSQQPSPPVPGDERSYSNLPTARILPHAIPTASKVDTGSESPGNRNLVPIDDVVENVVAMGFRRDLVRATVKKLTENGQSVDPNMVLDKLMNNG